MIMTQFESLQQKLMEKEAVVGVIGLGYVGLPLAIQMVIAGYTVIGIDNNKTKVQQLMDNHSYIADVSDETLQEANTSGRFRATAEFPAIAELDALCICVPTPLSQNQDPDVSFIKSAVENVKRYRVKPMLITLESTTYPGTTEEIIRKELESTGLTVGQDFFLCFSPERVDPGNGKYYTHNTPKVIGGTTPACLELGRLLYGNLVSHIVPVSSTKVAEMSKLLENTFRSINIAFINEMALMCDRMGINIWEVIDAAATKPFGFMPFYPGPGIGGHCIPLDPMYLSWKAKEFRFHSKFIELAQSTNHNMPYYVLNKTGAVLNNYSKSLRDSRILLLGVSYKPDIDDMREAPALYIFDLFNRSGAKVDYYDPYIPSFKDEAGIVRKSIGYDPVKLLKYDCIILITNHHCFNYSEIANLHIPIIDTRNAFKDFREPHIYKIGSPNHGMVQIYQVTNRLHA